MEERQDKNRKVKKQEEFMGIKLKPNVFVGEKRGSSTPTTSWKIGLAQSDGSLVHIQNSNFPIINTLSARKLGANLKKTQTHIKAINMNKGDSGVGLCKKEECLEPQTHMPQPPDDERPATPSSLRRHIAATLFQHHGFVGINGHSLQPVSLASPNSSLEVAPYYSAVTPASPLDFTDQGESSYNFKTSVELLKVLDHIRSLEEQHSSNLSLIKTLRRELEHSRTQIKKLQQEKKRDSWNITETMEQNGSDIAVKRIKEEDRTRNGVLSVRDEIASERTLRKHSESLHRKLARELSEVKSSFSNSLEEIKHERKTRILLENLCDEFAKGIKDYEQKVRSLKHMADKGFISREHPDQLILHISESWIDERMQMKLAATSCDPSDKITIADKMSLEIESLLQAKQHVIYRNANELTSKNPNRNSLRRYSLESFQLNDAASAPRNGDCEEDSIGSGLNSLDFKKHLSGTRTIDASKLLDDYGKKLMKSNPSRNKVQSRDVYKSNEYQSSSHDQFRKHSFPTLSCDENNVRVDNCRKSETTEASQDGKQIRVQSHDLYPDHVLHSITRNHSLSRNDGKLHSEKPCTEDSLDHSASSSHPTRKQGILLKITTSKPEVSESSRKELQGMKKHSLKARLLEAKLESRHSLMKNPKAPIH